MQRYFHGLCRRIQQIQRLALGLALLPLAASADRHALLIGVGDYRESGLPDLSSVSQDLKLMQSVLQDRLGGGQEGIQITVLLDQEATHLGIQAAIEALAHQVKPGDFVYLHYSGHGSQTPDRNGDEIRTGQDQTWVSYGARSPRFTGLDHYDILDDELHQWLAPIAERAQQVVVVSDSCHSGTMTRGNRGSSFAASSFPTSPMSEEHPLARQTYQPKNLETLVSVSAAQDDELAQLLDKQHSLFTWNWARALKQADSGETWKQIFDRTRIWMSHTHGQSQHPQISGTRQDKPAFGGGMAHPAVGTMVKNMAPNGEATLDAGYLVGATQGSMYAPMVEGSPVRLRLIQVNDTSSQAEVTGGTLKVGDRLREIEHVYPDEPLKVAVAGDIPETQQPLLERLRVLFPRVTNPKAGLSGFVLEGDERQADLVLYLLQPKRDAKGEYVYLRTSEGRANLPEPDPQAVPEVWVLTPQQRLLHDRLRVRLEPDGTGLEQLKTNLQRYRRVRALEGLANNELGLGKIRLGLLSYTRCSPGAPGCSPCAPDESGCHMMRGQCYRQAGKLAPEELTQREWRANDLISFQLENTGRTDRYVYLLDLADDGTIQTLFPRRDLNREPRLTKGETLDLSRAPIKTGLQLTPGEGGVIVITANTEINIGLLEQEGYETIRRRGSTPESIPSTNHPIEQLLGSALEGTRGGESSPPRVANTYGFGQQFFRYQVKADGENQ